MKKKITKDLFTKEFKLTHLGYGDWLDEPDFLEFKFKGIKCCIVRIVQREPYTKEEVYFGGYLCGYILLPKDHPLYGKKFHEIDLECHHGITYSQITEEGWLIGFDCAHSGDLVPTFEHKRNTDPKLKKIKEMYPAPEGFEKHPLFHSTYKNLDFCIKQCKLLAKQAAKMMVQ